MNKLIKGILISMAVLAVIGMIFILTIVNFKLLLWLNWYKISPSIDQIIAIISGFIFAIGSTAVIIWYNPKFLSDNKKNLNIRIIGSIILKVIFVSMDGIHIMIFLNNNNSSEFLNKTASTVYGIQTMLILLFIGSVLDKIIRNLQAKEDEKKVTPEDLLIKQTEIDNLNGKIDILQTDIEDYQSKIHNLESDIKDYDETIKLHTSKFEDYETDVQQKISQIKKQESLIKDLYAEINRQDDHISFLEVDYYKYNLSIIRKKKEENLTPKDIEMIQEAEKFLSVNS